MKFLVVTLAPTLFRDEKQQSYAPYVKEMNMWFSKVDEVIIVSPTKYISTLLLAPFERKDICVVSIPNVAFNSIKSSFLSLVNIPLIFLKLLREMGRADHIHLRCPATITLIGCLAQVFFPKKSKTAKYAGNWDPNAVQPKGYRFQKWLLSNTFWTKNMQVLVYGEWPGQTKNIKPFFTATYYKAKVAEVLVKKFNDPYKFLFVGSLSVGKRPLYAVKLIELLQKNGIMARLELYGDGSERPKLEAYIEKHELRESVVLHGNESQEVVEDAYKNNQFLLLPSKSEGWPKVVAESMFWGCVPMVSKISCIPWMLDQGSRGVLLSIHLENDALKIERVITQENKLERMSANAKDWSQQYTLDGFENEIKSILS